MNSRAPIVIGSLGAAIGIAGLAVGSLALSRVDSISASPPMVAMTPISDNDTHQAAVETCAAADTFRAAVGAVRQPYIDALKAQTDAKSPEFAGVEGRYFGGVAAELEYLRAHSDPAAPSEIATAVTELGKAATELLDADVRSLPAGDSNNALARLRAADSAVAAACEAHGAQR